MNVSHQAGPQISAPADISPTAALHRAVEGSASKRQKVTRACDRCKRRKRRCNGVLPCLVCISIEKPDECTYGAAYTRGKLVQPTPSSEAPPQPDASSGAPVLYRQEGVRKRSSDDSTSKPTAPSSTYAFLKRAWERFGKQQNPPGDTTEDEASQDMTSVLSHGDRMLATVLDKTIELPEQQTCAALHATYFDYTMPTYRFLHRPSVERWLSDMLIERESGEPRHGIAATSRSLVWAVLATSAMFNTATDVSPPDRSRDHVFFESERYYTAARRCLAAESGRPTLGSVQARLAICLYMLHTSRPNEAWYLFGTTVQLAFTIGLHRAREKPDNDSLVAYECRKRSFWALATLDTYLSVMLGRPTLIHDQDVTQSSPDAIDDENLEATPSATIGGDSVITASIVHAKVARITKKAARDPGLAHFATEQRKLETATRYNAELAKWNASLPVVLSGAIHPQSLISIFRRQIMVLRLAHDHACMLINRPLLLLDTAPTPRLSSCIQACLRAAERTLDKFASAPGERATFAAFWFTQYVAFNAVSIVYVWLIQRARGKLSSHSVEAGEEALMEKAEAVQRHFAEAADLNAPSLRYHVVLRELQQEVKGVFGKSNGSAIVVPNTQLPFPSSAASSSDALSAADPTLLPDYFNTDFDPDLWLQLDSFPFSDFSEMQLP